MLEELITKIYNYKLSRTISNKEKILLFKELSYLVKWWVWIVDALKIIWENSNNIAINNICDKLIKSLKKWETFSRSLWKLPKHFNEWDVSIIKSWENSWELENVLMYLSKEYSFIDNIKKQYISSLIYPVFLLLISLFAVYITFTVILPWVISLVDEFDAWELPFATNLMITLTEFFNENGFRILFWFFLMIFGFSVFVSTKEWKKWFDWAVLNIPIIWKITQYYYLMKFFRYKKLLISAWMDYKSIFKNLKNIMPNYYYKTMLDEVLVWINKWESFVDIMISYKNIIPSDIWALIKSWEETANIDTALWNVIEIYEEEFYSKLNNIWKMIEPIMILIVGVVIGFIAMWIFSIITHLIDNISL